MAAASAARKPPTTPERALLPLLHRQAMCMFAY